MQEKSKFFGPCTPGNSYETLQMRYRKKLGVFFIPDRNKDFSNLLD